MVHWIKTRGRTLLVLLLLGVTAGAVGVSACDCEDGYEVPS